ncbi:MAG: DUF3592 domain-containing protein [Desulfovibrionaceae bacterium]
MSFADSLLHFSLLMLFVPVFLGALFGLALTWRGIRKRAVMETWPTVDVEVVASRVEESEYRSWYFTTRRAWDMVVDYAYTHQGGKYRSQVRLEADVPGSGDDPSVLQNALAQAERRLLSGAETVRVNPAEPSETVWSCEPAGRATLRLLLFAVASAVAGVALGYIVLNY